MNRKDLQFILLFTGLFLLSLGTATAQWIKVGPSAGPGFHVFAMHVMGTDLYAGGTGIAKWDGTAWTPLGRVAPSTPLGLGSLGVNALAVYHGELYAAGDIDSMGGVYINPSVGVARWDGTTWSQVGSSAYNLSGVTSLVAYHDELYASGNYGVNKWDGTTWTNVATVDGPANVVLAVYHDELYAASSFSHIGAATMTVGKGFAKWDGTTWTALPGFFDTLSILPGINAAKAAAMTVFKDELYVIGSLDYAGTTFVRGVGRWNGTSWNTTNGGIAGNGELVSNCMSIDSNNLYVVGPIQKANATNDSIYLSAYWDGTKWNHMFGGNAAYTSFVTSINYNGEIYTAYDGFAKWTGPSAVPGIPNAGAEINIYPNPSPGTIHLSLSKNEPAQITVRNTLGATVYTAQVQPTTADYIVNVGDVPNGIYFIEISGKEKTETRKILIQK